MKRAAVATRVVETRAQATPVASDDADRQVLKFDFNQQRAPGGSKGPLTPREASTLKEAIIRWLDEQL